MADDFPVNGFIDATDMLELAICQPDHPNQAIFITSLDIKLKDFRTSITQNGLIVPEEWVFMTRLGSLISEDQEDRILLRTITRRRDDSGAVDVMVTPALSEHDQSERRPGSSSGRSDFLSSFATIVAAVRDIYVTSIQPNLHELIKPLVITTALAAVLTFALTFFLAMNFGVFPGLVQKSSLSTFLKRHVCGIPGDIDFVTELAKMQRKIDDLQERVSKIKQVEMGFFDCNEDTYKVQISFRKVNFTEVPQVIFAQSGVSNGGDLFSFEMDDVHVTQTGFSAQCSVRDRRFSSLTVSWIAAGKGSDTSRNG